MPDYTKDGKTATESQCRPFAKATNLKDFLFKKEEKSQRILQNNRHYQHWNKTDGLISENNPVVAKCTLCFQNTQRADVFLLRDLIKPFVLIA